MPALAMVAIFWLKPSSTMSRHPAKRGSNGAVLPSRPISGIGDCSLKAISWCVASSSGCVRVPMLADLNNLAQKLEADDTVKVVVFQSAHPEIFVAHADTEFLREMSGKAVSRDEVKLLDLQVVLERISKLPKATIAKIEGFAQGGGHAFALACAMRFAARGKAGFMRGKWAWASCHAAAVHRAWRVKSASVVHLKLFLAPATLTPTRPKGLAP